MFSVFDGYFGETLYFVLLLVLTLCLWNKRDKLFEKKILVSLMVFGITLSFLYYIFTKMEMENIFYRMLWLLPLVNIVSIASIWILKKAKNSVQICGLICIFTIVFGSNFLLVYNVELPDNIYKLDSDVIKVSEIIECNAETEDIRFVGEVSFMGQIRQYSSRFIWGYANRNCMVEASKGDMNDIYVRVAAAVQDEVYSVDNNIYADLKKLRIQYVVLYKEKQFVDHLPQGSYEIIGETEQYQVVKMNYTVEE